MTDQQPTQTANLDTYGDAPLPWSRARDILASSTPQPGLAFFLGTSRPDRRPHAARIAVPAPVPPRRGGRRGGPAGRAPRALRALPAHAAPGAAASTSGGRGSAPRSSFTGRRPSRSRGTAPGPPGRGRPARARAPGPPP